MPYMQIMVYVNIIFWPVTSVYNNLNLNFSRQPKIYDAAVIKKSSQNLFVWIFQLIFCLLKGEIDCFPTFLTGGFQIEL